MGIGKRVTAESTSQKGYATQESRSSANVLQTLDTVLTHLGTKLRKIQNEGVRHEIRDYPCFWLLFGVIARFVVCATGSRPNNSATVRFCLRFQNQYLRGWQDSQLPIAVRGWELLWHNVCGWYWEQS